MKKLLFFLFLIILILGCTDNINIIKEENVTPVYFEMSGDVPEHNVVLETSYPFLFENNVWNHMPITYYIDTETSQNISWFSETVIEQTKIGIIAWENATNGLITFKEVNSADEADISIFWNKNMGSGDTGVRIGEALPEKIIWTGYYNVLLGGRITQTPYATACVNRVISTHEIGHMLGLHHSENSKSIMYPYAWCYQTITPDIIEALEELYSIPFNENIDLYIENASLMKHGKYVDGIIYFGNKGITDTTNTTLSLIVNDVVVQEFDVERIDSGSTVYYSFKNALVDEDYDNITVELNKNRNFKELFYDNNFVVLG